MKTGEKKEKVDGQPMKKKLQNLVKYQNYGEV